MKYLITLACLFVFNYIQSQEIAPKLEKKGNVIKATYYYENGKIKQQGQYKNDKLEGKWIAYNERGEKTAIANYKAGIKEGRWLMESVDGLKEITYKNNKILNVSSSNVALK